MTPPRATGVACSKCDLHLTPNTSGPTGSRSESRGPLSALQVREPSGPPRLGSSLEPRTWSRPLDGAVCGQKRWLSSAVFPGLGSVLGLPAPNRLQVLTGGRREQSCRLHMVSLPGHVPGFVCTGLRHRSQVPRRSGVLDEDLPRAARRCTRLASLLLLFCDPGLPLQRPSEDRTLWDGQSPSWAWGWLTGRSSRHAREQRHRAYLRVFLCESGQAASTCQKP